MDNKTIEKMLVNAYTSGVQHALMYREQQTPKEYEDSLETGTEPVKEVKEEPNLMEEIMGYSVQTALDAIKKERWGITDEEEQQ